MREMTLRELQLFALDILKDVANFCNQNNLRYSLYGGTLLGAVRHHGFIPWDDDIDIIMPREDYDKFCRSYKSTKYLLVNRDNDKSYQLAYSRVCDINRTIYKAVKPCSLKATGVWIDVFPADGCPSDEKSIKDFYLKNQELFYKTEAVRWSMAPFYSEWCRTYNRRGLYRALRHMLGLAIRKYYYYLSGKRLNYINSLIKLNTTYKFGNTSFWASLSCTYKHIVYHPIESFENCIPVVFEDTVFFMLNGYDGLLKRVYGNYLELPPIEKQYPPLRGYYIFYWLS